MEYQIKYQFILHYYDDLYQYLSRIMSFLKNYYQIVFDEGYVLTKHKLDEIGKTEVIFGEIIPYFFDHNEVKNFIITNEKPMDELLDEIQNYILSFRGDFFNGDRNTIIISLNHQLDEI